MKISRKIPKEFFYRSILDLIRTIPPLNKLRPKELELLSEIMFQNDSMRDIDKNKRKIIIFSTENRKIMHEKLKCSQNIFNNNLSILKKHKLITHDNELIPTLDVDFKNGFNLDITITT